MTMTDGREPPRVTTEPLLRVKDLVKQFSGNDAIFV